MVFKINSTCSRDHKRVEYVIGKSDFCPLFWLQLTWSRVHPFGFKSTLYVYSLFVPITNNFITISSFCWRKWRNKEYVKNWRFCSERSSDVLNFPQMSSTELKYMNFCQYLKTEMHGCRLGCDFGEHRWSFGHFAASGGAAYPAREVCQAAQALQSRVDSRNLRWVSSNRYFDKSKMIKNDSEFRSMNF